MNLISSEFPTVQEVVDRVVATIEKEHECKCDIQILNGSVDICRGERLYCDSMGHRKLSEFMPVAPCNPVLRIKIWHTDATKDVDRIISHVKFLMGVDLPHYQDEILSGDFAKYFEESSWHCGDSDVWRQYERNRRLLGAFSGVSCTEEESYYQSWRICANFGHNENPFVIPASDMCGEIVTKAKDVRNAVRKWRMAFYCPILKMLGAIDENDRLIVWDPIQKAYVELPSLRGVFPILGIIRFPSYIGDDDITDMAKLANQFKHYANNCAQRQVSEAQREIEDAKRERADYDAEMRSFAEECGPVSNWPDFD